MIIKQDQNLLRLAGLLGDRSALEKVSGMDTQHVIESLVNIEPPGLSVELFVKLHVRDAFEADRVKLVSGLIELSENISSTKDLKKAMADYIQTKRAEYEAQGREKAEAWFHNMSIRRRRKRRKRFSPMPELKYLKGT